MAVREKMERYFGCGNHGKRYEADNFPPQSIGALPFIISGTALDVAQPFLRYRVPPAIILKSNGIASTRNAEKPCTFRKYNDNALAI